MTAKNKQMNRALIVLATLLLAIPLIYFFVMNGSAKHAGIELADLMRQEPQTNVRFIAACFTGVLGFHLNYLRTHYLSTNPNLLLVHLFLAVITLSLAGYLTIGLGIMLGIIYLQVINQVSVRSAWQDLTSGTIKLNDLLSSLVLLVFSMFVAFLLYRVS